MNWKVNFNVILLLFMCDIKRKGEDIFIYLIRYFYNLLAKAIDNNRRSEHVCKVLSKIIIFILRFIHWQS